MVAEQEYLSASWANPECNEKEKKES